MLRPQGGSRIRILESVFDPYLSIDFEFKIFLIVFFVEGSHFRNDLPANLCVGFNQPAYISIKRCKLPVCVSLLSRIKARPRVFYQEQLLGFCDTSRNNHKTDT